MLDIKFVRENPDIVKENIRKKFEDQKLPLVDEVIELDRQNREIKQELQALQADRNRISKEIGKLMHEGKKDEAMAAKEEVTKNQARVAELSEKEKTVEEELKKRMMVIPNIIDPSVPIARMIRRMSNFSGSGIRLSRIIRFPIIQRSWKSFMELTWMRQAALPAMASTICSAISQGFILPAFPTQEIL